MKVYLAGRAAEQIVFGRVTNGAANDLEKATELARAMVFEYGMSERAVTHDARRQLRALRGDEAPARPRAGPAHRPRLRGGAAPARRSTAPRSTGSPRQLLEQETLDRDELQELLGGDRGGVASLRDRRHACESSARGLSAVASPPWRPRGIHHLGVAVARSRPGARHLRAALRRASSSTARRFDDQGVEAASLRVGAGRVELLASLGDETPVGRFLADRGPGMHHVAYEVDDVGPSSTSSPPRVPS